MDELVGKRVGGYEILEKVGQGGMATVYRAQQISMNRVVAIKILPRQFLSDDSYMQRFNREVKIVSQLEHRNIVPVYDYGENNGQPFIVMRYMNAGSVDDMLARQGVLTIEQIVHIIEQVGSALDYAHTKGVLHRDLKPSNVLMDDDGGAYITDFGIARILGDTGPGITTQGVVGTPSYMSPEQAQGHTLDGRSDVYSLGVMLFEMATGRRPFLAETPYSIAVLQVTGTPPAPRSLNASITTAVEKVILRVLEKKAERRYPTGAALAEALRTASLSKAHDTQPTPLPRQDTMPSPALSPSPHAPPQPVAPQVPAPQYAVQSPVQSPPPMVYQPPVDPSQPQPTPGSYTGYGQQPAYAPSGYTGGTSAYVSGAKKRPDNPLGGLVIGGVIGCGLLAVLTAIAVVLAVLMTTGGGNPTPAPDGSGAVTPEGGVVADVTDAPTPNGTTGTDAVFSGTLVPIGQRPTSTPGAAGGPGRLILFFDERTENDNTDYDIYTIDLATGIETQLTAGGGTDSYPAASPDGQWVAFQSDVDGDFDIYIMDIFGRDTRALTNNTVMDRIPAWSPDGQWIIFSSDTNNDGNFDLYAIRPDGTDLRQVLSNGRRNSHARWSPDGTLLVFTTGTSDNANTWEIGSLDMTGVVQGANFRLLTQNDYADWSPNVHPDGSSIVFLTRGDGRSAVAVMDLASGVTTTVYDSPGYEWGAHWSLDGTRIAFNNDFPTGEEQVYTIAADGSDLQQVTTLGGLFPSWVR